jgi:phage gp37-like protein
MIITQIETALCERLRAGLGRMVDDVGTYGGEIDQGLNEVIRLLPAVWVTFGGVQQTKAMNTARNKFKRTALFGVLVGDKNTRSEASARHGGSRLDEVGTNNLVAAVTRIISGQDLGLRIEAFKPGAVRTLFNTTIEHDAMSVFACEFHTSWIERTLENGKYPELTHDTTHYDNLFTRYGGELSVPDPDWRRTHIQYEDPNTGDIIAKDIINYEN